MHLSNVLLFSILIILSLTDAAMSRFGEVEGERKTEDGVEKEADGATSFIPISNTLFKLNTFMKDLNPKVVNVKEEEEINGIDEKIIKKIMNSINEMNLAVKVSKEIAIKTLKAHGGNDNDAISELKTKLASFNKLKDEDIEYVMTISGTSRIMAIKVLLIVNYDKMEAVEYLDIDETDDEGMIKG